MNQISLEQQGQAAKAASRIIALASTQQKDRALECMAQALLARAQEWLDANAQDVAAAKEAGISSALLDRLTLNQKRVQGVVDGLRQLEELPDPCGSLISETVRPNGLRIEKRRVPLGVIAIIYEARPNVTVDAAALCLKSGNAVILRGGKEAFRSNCKAVEIMRDALEEAGLPADCIQLVQDTSRESSTQLMHLDQYVDVLIPRGGAQLIRTVAKEASVPVIRTGEGVCHIFVDATADQEQAAAIIRNAKCSRPSVCNALECVLVDYRIAAEFLPKMAAALDGQKPDGGDVEIRGCGQTCHVLGDRAVPATAEDWDAEYGDYILAVAILDGVDQAIDFIAQHGTGHSEAILTQDEEVARRFMDGVDAAAVYVNASTRFTDGGEFGMGAEIGISTQKMHARGPMGLEELTSSKFYVYGQGQVRE